MGPFVGAFETLCEALIILGLFTRLAAVPLIVITIVAILSTKIPILCAHDFWIFHDARGPGGPYFIGAYLFEQPVRPLLTVYGFLDTFNKFAQQYNDLGVWIVFMTGLTPFPYKIVTIGSGATGLNLLELTLASVLSRGLCFFVVAGLLYCAGPPIRDFIERRRGLVFTLFVTLSSRHMLFDRAKARIEPVGSAPCCAQIRN